MFNNLTLIKLNKIKMKNDDKVSFLLFFFT